MVDLTGSSIFDTKMRHAGFESEIQIIRFNFFRLPLSSIEQILDFMISQLDSPWGPLWMNEIQLIKKTVEHIQAFSMTKLIPQAEKIKMALNDRLPLTFKEKQLWIETRPTYGYTTEW